MKLLDLRSEIDQARKEIQKVIIGQEELIQYIFICFFGVGLNASPNIILTGDTGTGKTTLTNSLGTIFGLETSRVDGDSEKRPSDLIGSTDIRTGEFKEGPVFTNIFFQDEINRLVPGTRSSILAAMAEGIVVVDGKVLRLPQPFVAIGAQNPDSYRDTASLRLQERDRFCLSFFIGWPTLEDHLKIDKLNIAPPSSAPTIQKIFNAEKILAYREQIAKEIFVSNATHQYATILTRELMPEESDSSRVSKDVLNAAIIRGSRDLKIVARTLAAFRGDDHVLPEHVDEVAFNVLSHRISYKGIEEPSQEEAKDLFEEIKISAREKIIG